MNSTEMDVTVGSVSASTFTDPQFGAALLASQFRDSFFEVQDEVSKPTLALVNRKKSPLSLFDESAPDPHRKITVDGINKYALTIFASEVTMEAITCLKHMWDEAIEVCDDLVGGIFTVEYSSKDGLSLIQVIKVGDWIQLRKHPFVRDEEGIREIDNPLVEESTSGVITNITDSMGF